VGYPKETRGNYFYNAHENKVFVARDAVFLEKDFISSRQSGRKFELDEVQEPQTENEVEENVPSSSSTVITPSEPRRSGRISRQPDRYLGVIEKDGDYEVLLLESDEPVTHKAAISCSDSKHWLEAMQSKMDSMFENQVWDLVDLPEEVRPLQCKWIFKIKIGMDEHKDVHKARLVAKSFTQVHGLHYDETFAPIAML
jgi:hypothetical protein